MITSDESFFYTEIKASTGKYTKDPIHQVFIYIYMLLITRHNDGQSHKILKVITSNESYC